MRKKSASGAIAIVLVAAIALSGCGTNSGTASNETKNVKAEAGQTEAAETNSTENAENTEKTVVTFQTWNPADGGPDSAIYKIIDAFEAENPDIEINYVYVDSGSHKEQLKVELMGGEGPDIYGMNTGVYYSEFRDFEEDVTPYCEKTRGSEWKNQFLDSCLSMLESDGAYYGLPLGMTYAGLAWSDVNMLKEYGLEVPKSYTELLEAGKVLRENGQLPMAIGAKDSWLNGDTFMSIANDVNSEKLYSAIEGETPFTDPDMVEAFRIWQNCFNDGVFQDGAIGMTLYNDVNDMFQKEGSIPLMLNGSWALNMYTLSDTETQATFHSEGADHDIFLVDWNDDGKVGPMTMSVDVVLCMNQYSEVKEEAFRFMDYLVHEGQELLVNGYLEYMPTLSDMELQVEGLSEDGQKNLEFVCENAKTNVGGSRMIDYSELYTKLLDMLEALAINEVTPEEAAGQLEAVSKSIQR